VHDGRGSDRVLARADLERTGEYSPMTLIELDSGAMRRSEGWPDDFSNHVGRPRRLGPPERGLMP
jgi:hypothetical protein